MRPLQLIVLIWVIAVLATHSWQHFVRFMASSQVDRQTEQYNAEMRKALAE